VKKTASPGSPSASKTTSSAKAAEAEALNEPELESEVTHPTFAKALAWPGLPMAVAVAKHPLVSNC
jgi:hypothetical protein